MCRSARGIAPETISGAPPKTALAGPTPTVLSGVCLTGSRRDAGGGVLVLGDRPTPWAWSGIAVTAPALWLLSTGRTTSPEHQDATTKRVTGDGLLASMGVAIQYLALAQAGPSSGLRPVAAGRLAAVIVLVPAADRHQRLSAIRSVQAIADRSGRGPGTDSLPARNSTADARGRRRPRLPVPGATRDPGTDRAARAGRPAPGPVYWARPQPPCCSHSAELWQSPLPASLRRRRTVPDRPADA